MKPKLGRNDPCHCGSGKKYKRCHLAADEQARTAGLSAPPASGPLSLASPVTMLESLGKLARQGSAEQRAAFAELSEEAGPLLQFLERRADIQAAELALKPHQDQLQTLLDAPDAYSKRTWALFGEERFAPLRFTAEEVARACQRVGFSPGVMLGSSSAEKLRQAILSLADKRRRSFLSMSLLMHLPELVAEGRYLDGLLVQLCAVNTAEEEDASNPFLFQMFSYGYDACVAAEHQREKSLLQQVGLDLEHLKGMGLQNMDALAAELKANPDLRNRAAALLEKNPDLKARAEADLVTMERESGNLFDRADSRGLLLPDEELELWMPKMVQAIERLQADTPGLTLEAPPTPEIADRFFNALLPVLREMAQAIFTPERLRNLAAQLRQYRNQLLESGERLPARWAQGALSSVEREDQPGLNSFLLTLCFASLRSLPPQPEPKG